MARAAFAAQVGRAESGAEGGGGEGRELPAGRSTALERRA